MQIYFKVFLKKLYIWVLNYFKMKTIKVSKTFKDKETKEVHKAGTEVEYSNKRADEIIASGFGVDVTPEEEKKSKKKTD